MLCGRNGIEVKWVWLCEVSKRMGRFVVRLKGIKYKVDVVRYLSSHPSSLGIKPSHQAACFQTLSFRSLTFRFSTKHIRPSFLGSRIRKAIRKDPDPNGIELRKVESQQMGCWWVEAAAVVKWRLVRFSTIRCKKTDSQQIRR